ncbi:uncharacterized protein LOC111273225 [Varroa jacobsoni]|uniref:uncharacterized protein LOC111273225 n=1 Tax=Varroa jacobsoni TaxID=62625 RepID=UPI000BF4C1CC|nr:uncharacterized protein LOC111273225 [Varroa jacobsoni]
MEKNAKFRSLQNPANVCRHLQSNILASVSNSISLAEVRRTLATLMEGDWSDEDIIGFFTYSQQKIFKVSCSQLYMNDQESSSEEEDECPVVTPNSTEKRSFVTSAQDNSYLSKSDGEKQYFSDSDSERQYAASILQQYNQYLISKSQIKEKIVLAPKKQSITRVRLVTTSEGSGSSSDSDKPAPKERKASTTKRRHVASSELPSHRISSDDDVSSDIEDCLKKDRSIKENYSPAQQNVEATCPTRAFMREPQKITTQIIDSRPPLPRVNLCDSESDNETAANNSRKNLHEKKDFEAETARQLKLKHMERTKRENNLSGFFDRKDTLDEERSGSHDSTKIYNDLMRYTNGELTYMEIKVYLEYFRSKLGGNIGYLSTGSVVAAVLDMYEVDKDKERLNDILINLERAKQEYQHD